LDPFGTDVADDLAPFGIGVHAREKSEPGDAGDDEKNAQGMAADEIHKRIFQATADGAAFLGAAFQQVCGGDDDNE
jgi:hypothetical protein